MLTTRIVFAWVFVALASAGFSVAQTYPPAPGPDRSDVIFADDVLPVVRITIDPAYLEAILDPANRASDDEYVARFEFESPYLTETVDSVGFRLRGNTSRASQKKSFRVSFNTFAPGRKFKGLEKLNLNGEHNDPSIMRTKLAWDLFAEAGVPASRSVHTELYINGEYYGLMINVEQVDEQFLQRWFGDDSGNLYKCLWPADLTFRGETGDAYRPSGPDRRPYDLQLGASDAAGYDDLAELISVINRATDANFKNQIEKVLDVNSVLRAQAVMVLTGSWDSYWFLKNNFYLYSDPGSRRFVFVPFDMDNSFGVWWSGIYPGIDWGTRNPYAWGHPSEPRPLMRRLLAVPEYRERFTMYLRRLTDGSYWSGIADRISALRGRNDPAAEADVIRTLDWGYTIEDYRDSFILALGDRNAQQGHVTYGLLPFISERDGSLRSQLDVGAIAPVVSQLSIAPSDPRPTEPLDVTVRIESEAPLVTVEVEYWPAVPQKQVVAMDPAPDLGPGRYRATVPPLGKVGVTDLRIHAVDANGTGRTIQHVSIGIGWTRPALFINELMASNTSTIADENGEYDDWVELFNGSDAPISLAGYYLSDAASNPLKWAFPDTTIAPGGHLIVWTDGDPEQGPLHADFRLNADGESLYLTRSPDLLTDQVEFGVQTTDLSWARVTDGEAKWSAVAATPGTENGGSTAVDPVRSEVPEASDRLRIWPNPSSGMVNLSVESGESAGFGTSFTVFDVLGRLVTRIDASSGRAVWDGRGDAGVVPPGVYYVRSERGTVAAMIRVR